MGGARGDRRAAGWRRRAARIAAWLCLSAAGAGALGAQVQRVRFEAPGRFLVLDFLRDDLVHFAFSATPPAADAAILTTPQVAQAAHPGPGRFERSDAAPGAIETAALKVAVDPATLCVAFTDLPKNRALTTVCPQNLAKERKGLTLTAEATQDVYGLGQQFAGAAADGNWTTPRRDVRTPGDAYGNQLVEVGGGMVGNVQVPVMTAVGPDANYALLLDQVQAQRWDFGVQPWKMETSGDALRGFLIAGATLPDLRRTLMTLTGRPPVPPKKMFGLWLSEFGYDGWDELESKLKTLRAAGFPIDGFVLDLQWFGGVPVTGTRPSRMGSLDWDTQRFPDPAGRLARYRTQEGLGFITIEESYVDRARPEHADLKARGFLVRAGCATCDPADMRPGADWWGSGGMLDWTLDAAADHWHDTKRRPLIEAGVIGHWIDLGEPENYDPGDWAAGVLPGQHGHAAYHNVYNLKWAEGIARGYARHGEPRRPFMLSRSGAAGIQRFGAALWSGDIGADFDHLAAQFNVQMQMSMSGIDYFGSDIGGFHRRNLGGKALDLLYTQWFAAGAAFDVPVRPHVENLCNCKETAPDRIGDVPSNLANVRLRYALAPYLYSLAHRAWLDGEPVVPPLVFHHQSDPAVRRIGSEKLLGRDLLVAAVADRSAPVEREVILPAGDWVDFHDHRWLHSRGQRFAQQPLQRGGLFRLPMYARAGAIVPLMHVDAKTMNITGLRSDGSVRDELIARVFASPAESRFTLYEDDGETVAYQQGAVRRTELSQQLAADGRSATVTVAAAAGSYRGAPEARDTVIELVLDGLAAQAVALDGVPLPERATAEAFDAAASGWINAGPNLVRAKSGRRAVGEPKAFVFTLAARRVVQ